MHAAWRSSGGLAWSALLTTAWPLAACPAALAQCDYTVELIQYSDCGPSGVFASVIGEAGHVAGTFASCSLFETAGPFVWTSETGVVALERGGGTSFQVTGVTNAGEAVGTVDNQLAWWHSDGSIEIIGLPGPWKVVEGVGRASPNGRYVALSLNDAGPLVGVAARLTDRRSFDIVPFDQAGWSTALGISVSDDGVLVGRVALQDGGMYGTYLGFSYDGESVTLMPREPFEHWTMPVEITARGEIGGSTSMDYRGWPSWPFRSLDGVSRDRLVPANPPECFRMHLYDMNDRGDAVGWCTGEAHHGIRTLDWLVLEDRLFDVTELHLVDPPDIEHVAVLGINGAGQILLSGRVSGDSVDLVFTPQVTPGDATGDCDADTRDLLQLLGDWGPCGEFDCSSDLTSDGVVDNQDLRQVLENWG